MGPGKPLKIPQIPLRVAAHSSSGVPHAAPAQATAFKDPQASARTQPTLHIASSPQLPLRLQARTPSPDQNQDGGGEEQTLPAHHRDPQELGLGQDTPAEQVQKEGGGLQKQPPVYPSTATAHSYLGPPRQLRGWAGSLEQWRGLITARRAECGENLCLVRLALESCIE